MNTLDFSAQLADLDGVKQRETMSKALASSLVMGTEGDALKFLGWGRQLHKTGGIDVDDADLEALKSHVRDSSRLPIWVKGQLLEVLIAAKSKL
jgi:hypothetical protein